MPRRQLYGGETAKAVANFPISGSRPCSRSCAGSAGIKGAGGAVNGELGCSTRSRRAHPARAGDEIAAGKHDAQFPIDVFQTGSGTSSNMNANEVIAELAGEAPTPTTT